MKTLFIGVIFSVIVLPIQAIEFEDAIFPELATSGRALAMGNAYVASVDDSSSVYYNPAGLGTVRHKHFHLSNFHFESNTSWLSLGGGGKIADAASNFAKGFSLDGTRELLDKNPGVLSHSRFHMLPNFTMRYFSLGYLFALRQRATIGFEQGADFEYATRRDHGPYAALNVSLFGGIFKIGASATILERREKIGTHPRGQTIELQDGDYQKGIATIVNAGAKLTLPFTWLPTFALVMHNALEADFAGRALGPPATIKNSMDLGFSLSPQIGQAARVHFEVDYKDVSQEYSNISATRKLLAGVELDLARTFFFRLGYGDGFGSGGIGMRTRKLEFDLTTYAVDTTVSGLRGKEDRRLSLTLSSGF